MHSAGRELEVELSTDPVFQRIFADNPIGEALVEEDGRLARVNEAMCRFLGRTAEELVGLTLDDITDPRDLQTDLELVGQLFGRQIEGYAIDKRFLLPDGSIAWGRLTASLLRDVERDLLYGHGRVQDVTAEKEAQARAEQERLRLELALSVASIATWELDLGTGRLSASENFPEVYGVALTSIQELLVHVHDGDRESVRRAIDPNDTTFRTRSALTFRIVTPAGDVRWIHARGHLVLDDDRRPTSIIGTGLDATMMRSALEARLRVERLHRETQRLSPTAFLAVDERGRIVDWNDAATSLFGWTAAEATTGRVRVPELFDASARPRWVDFAPTMLSSGLERTTTIAVDRHGRRVPVEVAAGVFVDGTSRTVLAHVVDRSEVRDALTALVAAHAKDELTGLDNRRRFLAQVSAAVTEVRRRRPLGIVLVRLDGRSLGALNASAGYAAGDEALQHQAARLAALAGGAPLGRLDGTTFAVLWGDAADAEGFAAAAVAALAEPVALRSGAEVALPGRSVVTIAEVGAAVVPDAVVAEGERRLRG